ncbi:MAG: aspartate carbamoyltransferase catalytic subunit [Thermaerobacter sp.]
MSLSLSMPAPAVMPAPGDAPPALRHLLGIRGLTRSQAEALLAEARSWKAARAGRLQALSRRPLAGRRIVTVFYEPSTRTMTSFHVAAAALGAEAVDLPVSRSSVQKGERLDDTLETLESLGADAVVLRHPQTGAAHYAARHLSIPVINGGDGTGEHPTQALTDALTILERRGRVAGLKVAILGDIRHSRVARSNALLLELLGAEVWLSGPAAALPPAGAFGGARVTLNRDEALEGADVVMALRVQRERQARGLLPPPGAYRSRWGLDARDLERCSPDVVLLHPGPVNRDVEVDGRLLEDPRCAVLQQVANGVAVRMAVLHTLLGQGGGRSWSTCSSAAGW